MSMWQQLLDRFVPLMDGDVSALDQRDGVGARVGGVAAVQTRMHDAEQHSGRATFDGSARPLT